MSKQVWTKEQQKEHRNLWIKALRSGEYKQGFDGFLRDIDDRYCCLGVACEIAAQNNIIPKAVKKRKYCYKYGIQTAFIPEEVQKYYGFTSASGYYDGIDGTPNQNTLTRDNDIHHLNFFEIADLIEREPEGLFE